MYHDIKHFYILSGEAWKMTPRIFWIDVMCAVKAEYQKSMEKLQPLPIRSEHLTMDFFLKKSQKGFWLSMGSGGQTQKVSSLSPVCWDFGIDIYLRCGILAWGASLDLRNLTLEEFETKPFLKKKMEW